MPNTAQGGINFVPAAELKQNVESPFIAWFFKTGVYFLLLTYGVVLLSFAYRWYSENNLSGINNSIQENSSLIAADKEFIDNFKATQSKFTAVGNRLATSKQKSTYLQLVEQTIPQPITLIDMLVEEGSMKVQGITEDYLAVTQWQNLLQKNEAVDNVELSEVERNIETDANDLNTNAVIFTFIVTLK